MRGDKNDDHVLNDQKKKTLIEERIRELFNVEGGRSIEPKVPAKPKRVVPLVPKKRPGEKRT